MKGGRPLAVGLFVGVAAGFAVGFVLASGGFEWPADPPAYDPAQRPPRPPAPGDVTGPGPHEGYVLVVDPARLYVEVVHNEHWGLAAAYLFDPEMNPLDVKTPPVLNVMFDGASHKLEASRENWDEEEDGGWHFEHDALLGEIEFGRWRIAFDGRTYSPVLRHVHLEEGHGPRHTHGAATEEVSAD